VHKPLRTEKASKRVNYSQSTFFLAPSWNRFEVYIMKLGNLSRLPGRIEILEVDRMGESIPHRIGRRHHMKHKVALGCTKN
jgi:hypothetical protein